MALAGWGGSVADARVVEPETDDAVASVVASASTALTRRTLIARGLGRSYGDAAQSAGGLVVSTSALDEIGGIGGDGVVEVEAGVSLGALEHRSFRRAGSSPSPPAPATSRSAAPWPPTSTARTTTWTAGSAGTSRR